MNIYFSFKFPVSRNHLTEKEIQFFLLLIENLIHLIKKLKKISILCDQLIAKKKK